MEALLVSSTNLPIDLVRHILLPLSWDSHTDEKLKHWFIKFVLPACHRNYPFNIYWQQGRKVTHKLEADRLEVRLDPRTPEHRRLRLIEQSRRTHLDIIRFIQLAKQRRRHSMFWRYG